MLSATAGDRGAVSRETALDEKKTEHLKSVPPSLKAALRQARVEGAEQNQAVADVRETEIARLELLEEAVRPVVEQAPEDVDLFDLGIAHGERPRLFIDMIGFVEMAHDRRSYRFLQDTRHGRVLIAESERVERLVAAITNYVARRLVERERALASDWRSRERAAADDEIEAPASTAEPAPAKSETKALPLRPRARGRRWTDTLADGLSFLLTTLGAIMLCGVIIFAAYLFWVASGRELWTAHFGTPPF